MESRKLVPCWMLVCTIFSMIGGSAIPRRETADIIDDIIDLDADYLTSPDYQPGGDFWDTSQYYFRHNSVSEFTTLRRNPHIDLNAPFCTVENGNIVCHQGTDRTTTFYADKDGDISVSISKDNGTLKMGGLVRTMEGVYQYEPVLPVSTQNTHIRRKRWTANVIPPRPKRAARKKAKSPKNRRVSNSRKTAPSFGSKNKFPNWKTPSGSEYCVDVLCVVDYSIYKKFQAVHKSKRKTEERIRYYYAHVINGINMRYASLAKSGINIKVRLAGYFVAKKSKDLPFMKAYEMAHDPTYRVNGRQTLEDLDKFIKRLGKKKSKVLPDYNHCMLFLEYTATNLQGTILANNHIDQDVYQYAFQHGEPKDGVSGDEGGTSFVMGICSLSHSTSLVVDHGAYTSSGIGSHELGHNLGVRDHDGEKNASMCSAAQNYIMAPASYIIDPNNLKYSFSFSQCSIKQIKDMLARLGSGSGNCLLCNRRSPGVEKLSAPYLSELPGVHENVHDQCRQLYGRDSFMCPPKTPTEICYRMYCYDSKRSACAIISEQMAAPGTPCGNKKWCILGRCVSDTRAPSGSDECPYPDIPQKDAHCEDASPFMCRKEQFRKKCCNSCNKDFTPEESCKDTHVPINGMQCPVLLRQFYAPGLCNQDYNVKNYCCRGCRTLLITIGVGHNSIHVGVQAHPGQRPVPLNAIQSKQKNRNSSVKSKIMQKMSPKSKQKPPAKPPKPSGIRSPSDCTDNPYVKFNGLVCAAIVQLRKSQACANADVLKYCCESCKKYTRK